MEGKELFPFTSGKNKFDFISVEDLCTMIALASTQTAINGIINRRRFFAINNRYIVLNSLTKIGRLCGISKYIINKINRHL